MNKKCYVDSCRQEIKYSCACDQNIRICKKHLSKHTQLPGSHTINKIAYKKRKKSFEDKLRNLDTKRKLIQFQGSILINEILNILKKIDKAIDCKEKEMLLLIESNKHCSDLDQNIKNMDEALFSIDIIDNFINYSNRFFAAIEIHDFFQISLERKTGDTIIEKNEVFTEIFQKESLEINTIIEEIKNDNEIF